MYGSPRPTGGLAMTKSQEKRSSRGPKGRRDPGKCALFIEINLKYR